MRQFQRIAVHGTGVSAVLFALSLCLPALYYEARPDDGEIYGIGILLIGWMGFGGPLNGEPGYLGWFANPLFLFAILQVSRNRNHAALISATFALGFALTSFALDTVIVNEAGHAHAIVAYGPGFFLWLSAICLAFVSTFAMGFNSRATRGDLDRPSVFFVTLFGARGDFVGLSVFVAGALLVASAFFPFFHIAGDMERSGMGQLLVGWIPALEVFGGSVDYMFWIANPLVVVGSAFLIRGNFQRARFCAIIAAGFAALSLFMDKAIPDRGHVALPIISRGLGCYLWLSAIGWNLAISVAYAHFFAAPATHDVSHSGQPSD